MEYRLFGRSGLKVSALGYGCMTFGDPSNGNVRTPATTPPDSPSQLTSAGLLAACADGRGR
eukprot:COSAG04_NODE_27886_length_279_cov_0.577778_1_plen_60_part_10